MSIMDGTLFAALCMGAGALSYCIWGFLQAKKEADASGQLEEFDIVIALTTILPTIIGALLSGLAITVALPATLSGIIILGVSFATSGFGIASAQGMLGINNFFRIKKPTTPA